MSARPLVVALAIVALAVARVGAAQQSVTARAAQLAKEHQDPRTLSTVAYITSAQAAKIDIFFRADPSMQDGIVVSGAVEYRNNSGADFCGKVVVALVDRAGQFVFGGAIAPACINASRYNREVVRLVRVESKLTRVGAGEPFRIVAQPVAESNQVVDLRLLQQLFGNSDAKK